MTLSPSVTSLAIVAILVSVANAFDNPQTCNSNPECAALGLVDNCCPTNLAGIFLDCCDDPGPSCKANAGCRDLVDDCCPAADGTYLYCCFDPDPADGGYEYDFNHFGDRTLGMYETGPGMQSWTGWRGYDRTTRKYEYRRNVELLYDLIYITGFIPDAGAYITGEKKFSIDLDSGTAPPCTQILLQFEHLTTIPVPLPGGVAYQFDKPYPEGRHSRYLATMAPKDGNGHIKFDFLDRPDESVLDSEVNAVSILIAPGTYTSDTYTFSRLDSHTKCSGGEGCESSPTKTCPALYVTGEGPVTRVLQQQDVTDAQGQPECSDCANPTCVGVGKCSMANSMANLGNSTIDDVPEEEPASASSSKMMFMAGNLMFFAMMAITLGTVFFVY